MKKIYALGVAGLLMMGTASQASAATWAPGDLIMSVYNTSATIQEVGFDLGSIDTYKNATSAFNVFSGDNKITTILAASPNVDSSGIGIYETDGVGSNKGYFATTNGSGKAAVGDSGAIGGFESYVVGGILPTYAGYDSGNTGKAAITDGFTMYPGLGSGFGSYGGVNKTPGIEPELTTVKSAGYQDMFLYQFNGDSTQVGNSYIGTFRLTSAGDLTFTPNSVPIPAAVWLLGSGLLGLAGIRRKSKS